MSVQAQPTPLVSDADAENLRQALIAEPSFPVEVKPLLEGMGSSVFKGLLDMIIARAIDYLKDPANLQLILSKLFEIFTKKN